MEDFHFHSPALLWLLLVLPVQAFLIWAYWRWRQRTLRQLGSPVLVQRLLHGFRPGRFWLKHVLYGLALLFLGVAIADPRHRLPTEAKEGRGADVVFALDVSASMWATDVSPSRLERVRSLALRAVTALEGHRIGLVFFAGDAFGQIPLTTDYNAVRTLLQQAGPEFIAQQGTDLGMAIETAMRQFEPSSPAGRALILFTDGEDHEGRALTQVQAAKTAGIRIFAVGVGQPEGAKILQPTGAPLRDESGAVVYSRPNFTLLRQLAQLSGGQFFDTEQRNVISSLVAECDNLQKAAVALQAEPRYTYYFVWFALAAWLLLAFEQVLPWRPLSWNPTQKT
ncbi:MAG: VWA domain-containing protein [Saprospiraceae bacterium]|nr:VWA domain-containing protein [Saprospiraceae bacterium]MDW8482725.1 VWA domain-containing protein [Saprospiraceae bacterium]